MGSGHQLGHDIGNQVIDRCLVHTGDVLSHPFAGSSLGDQGGIFHVDDIDQECPLGVLPDSGLVAGPDRTRTAPMRAVHAVHAHTG